MKKLLLCLVSVLLIGTMVGCSKDGATTNNGGNASVDIPEAFNEQVISAGEVRVGTSPNYAPFEFIDESGTLTGFDIELMNKLGEITGVKIVYSQLEFETIVASLQAGTIDLGMSGFTYSEDRDVIFSKPYYESAQVALLPIESSIASIADLEGKMLGAGLGTTGDKAARAIPNAQVTNPSNEIAFQMVQSGQLDAYICDLGVAINYEKSGKYKILEEQIVEEPMSFIVKNGNTEIEKLFNEALDEFMKTKEYDELLEKYSLS